MQFDKDAYKDFLTKHSKDGTDPVDLLERYAITLSSSTTNDEIKQQLTAVRAYWNQTANGNNRAAKKADWCRKRDAELKAQHGDKLETVDWWQRTAQAEAGKASAAIQALADSLRGAYGQLGVVTTDDLNRDGARNKLSPGQAAQAASKAGLAVISDKVTLPEAPLSSTVFKDLLRNLNDCQVPTIPELLHPGSGTFRIVGGYECVKSPALRLETAAIEQQKTEAGKAITPTNTAKLDALRKLSDADQKKVDLRDIVLYHLMELVADTQPIMAKQELVRVGVEAGDAAIIAALLQHRQKATQVNRLDQVVNLLAEGQLKEAESLANTLPDGDEKVEAGKQVIARRKELADLLARAEQEPDEAQAEKLLRDAARVSREDADERLRRLPLPPPGPVTATGDGDSVKVFWQRGLGHDESTVYVVARTLGRAPAAPGDGTQVHRGIGTECADSGAPAATQVQYGVFATAEGRPPSKPVIIPVTPLPPVWNLKAEAGTGTVTLSWKAKPEAKVLVTRATPGAAPVHVPVSEDSVQLRDLPDGVAQFFEVVAVYRGPDGAELRSHPKTETGTPRGEAKPNGTLKVATILAGGRTRVRATWKHIDNSKVTILLTAADQPWPFGIVISPEEARRAGNQLAGHVEVSGADRVLEAELPGGIHYLTPLSEGGTGVAVGKSQSVAIIEPVTNLITTPFADHATLAWHWPDTVQLAEVSWKAQGDDEDSWESFMLSRAEYQTKGGAQVPLATRPVDVEVRAVITANGKRHPSAPVKDAVTKVVKTPIRYRVAGGGPFGGRAKKVTFTADQPCSGTAVRMIAVPGTVKPSKPNEGVIVFETTLNLTPGVPAEHKVELPKTIKKPYWVRCFVMSGPGRLVDPPVGDMKED
ncbi:MAG TPA: hypothetical protein VI365_37540 [Trebonia sp.]